MEQNLNKTFASVWGMYHGQSNCFQVRRSEEVTHIEKIRDEVLDLLGKFKTIMSPSPDNIYLRVLRNSNVKLLIY